MVLRLVNLFPVFVDLLLIFAILEQSKVFKTGVSTNRSSNDNTDQYHDLLPPGFLLILESLLGVIITLVGVL